MRKHRTIDFQKGISLYLSLLVVAILLAMILGLSTLSLFQIKMIRGMGDSVSALYAAETGIEVQLYYGTSTPPLPYSFDGRSYQLKLLNPGEGDCPLEANYCIESVGVFKNTRRALRIIR